MPINGANPDHKYVEFGVTQESILRPLLFLISFSDLANSYSKFTFIIYSDDTTLTNKNLNMDNMIQDIQMK